MSNTDEEYSRRQIVIGKRYIDVMMQCESEGYEFSELLEAGILTFIGMEMIHTKNLGVSIRNINTAVNGGIAERQDKEERGYESNESK